MLQNYGLECGCHVRYKLPNENDELTYRVKGGGGGGGGEREREGGRDVSMVSKNIAGKKSVVLFIAIIH
jgi:hypothetical protein